VKVGLDLGKDVDIIAGLKEGDIVINSPPDSLSNGDLVRVAGENEKKGAPAAKKEQLSEAGK
jgi:multidrug efflux system membrane fusion protein